MASALHSASSTELRRLESIINSHSLNAPPVQASLARARGAVSAAAAALSTPPPLTPTPEGDDDSALRTAATCELAAEIVNELRVVVEREQSLRSPSRSSPVPRRSFSSSCDAVARLEQKAEDTDLLTFSIEYSRLRDAVLGLVDVARVAREESGVGSAEAEEAERELAEEVSVRCG